MHGYTSDSDSEDEYNQAARGAVPAGSTPVDAAKAKKKKPKMPPQLRINRIWKRFSNRKFTRALAVLPFEPVQPSAASDRANELLGDGYRRAADECSRKVDKIIEECRRVNMRYRDPGWDLVSFCGERSPFISTHTFECLWWPLLLKMLCHACSVPRHRMPHAAPLPGLVQNPHPS
jgi:hypothetical protein